MAGGSSDCRRDWLLVYQLDPVVVVVVVVLLVLVDNHVTYVLLLLQDRVERVRLLLFVALWIAGPLACLTVLLFLGCSVTVVLLGFEQIAFDVMIVATIGLL